LPGMFSADGIQCNHMLLEFESRCRDDGVHDCKRHLTYPYAFRRYPLRASG